MSKSKLKLFLILLIPMGILVVLYFFKPTLKTNTNSVQVNDVKTQIVNEHPNWKEYKNTKYGFSVLLPEDRILIGEDTPNGTRFEIGWANKTQEELTETGTMDYSIGINVQDSPTNLAGKPFTIQDIMEDSFYFEENENEKFTPITLQGRQGLRYETKIRNESYILAYRFYDSTTNRLYFISGVTADKNLVPLIEEILNTFKFI